MVLLMGTIREPLVVKFFLLSVLGARLRRVKCTQRAEKNLASCNGTFQCAKAG